MDTHYSRRFVVGGNETAIFSYDILKDEHGIGEFYRELAAECEAFCERELSGIDSYRARACRIARYSIEAREIGGRGNELSVSFKVSCAEGRGEWEIIFSEIHSWDMAEGLMLPPRKNGLPTVRKKNRERIRILKTAEKEVKDTK